MSSKLPAELSSWPFPEKPSAFYRLKSKIVISMVYLASKAYFSGPNKMVVRNKETLMECLADRSRPLITVSNHRCVMDDPFFWSILSLREFSSTLSRFRWVLAAHNICFTKPLHTRFFSLGQCIPVVRGAGVWQTGVDFCVDIMSKNGWVHMFPEGKVTRTPMRIKWGISRLINESATPPILLPIWLTGMEEAWPKAHPYYPKAGKVVEVEIGTPVDTADFLKNLKEGATELERRKAIADFVQEKLFELGRVKVAS